MTKRFAFTLAEVLIALAIIGVVAAMTIPTFMANTAGAQFRTGFKKGITVLTQAASANYATEGYDFGGTNVPFGTAATTTDGVTTPGQALATHDGSQTVTNARIGFDTTPDKAGTNELDLADGAQSLFHLFQGNLNMKNSNEVVNYDVGMPDVALHCDGEAISSITVPGITNPEAPEIATMANMGTRPAATNSETPTDAQRLQTIGGIANFCTGRSLANGGFNQGRMFALEDGMTFTYDAGQASCTENNPCYGYIDINGPQGPNKIISCTNGNNSYIPSYGRDADASLLMTSCTVEAKDITDIYPVLFYGSTVKPASLAAKAVLYSQKSNQTSN